MNFVKCCVFSSTLIVAFSVAAATAADYVAIMIILFMNFIYYVIIIIKRTSVKKLWLNKVNATSVWFNRIFQIFQCLALRLRVSVSTMRSSSRLFT